MRNYFQVLFALIVVLFLYGEARSQGGLCCSSSATTSCGNCRPHVLGAWTGCTFPTTSLHICVNSGTPCTQVQIFCTWPFYANGSCSGVNCLPNQCCAQGTFIQNLINPGTDCIPNCP